jgi:hypothetical protein
MLRLSIYCFKIYSTDVKCWWLVIQNYWSACQKVIKVGSKIQCDLQINWLPLAKKKNKENWHAILWWSGFVEASMKRHIGVPCSHKLLKSLSMRHRAQKKLFVCETRGLYPTKKMWHRQRFLNPVSCRQMLLNFLSNLCWHHQIYFKHVIQTRLVH